MRQKGKVLAWTAVSPQILVASIGAEPVSGSVLFEAFVQQQVRDSGIAHLLPLKKPAHIAIILALSGPHAVGERQNLEFVCTSIIFGGSFANRRLKIKRAAACLFLTLDDTRQASLYVR